MVFHYTGDKGNEHKNHAYDASRNEPTYQAGKKITGDKMGQNYEKPYNNLHNYFLIASWAYETKPNTICVIA